METLALLDVDGTLVDETYQMNADLSAVISMCQEAGVTIGLCSDTPHVSLARLAERLRIDGPIVAEMGACVAQSPSAVCLETFEGETSYFLRLRQAVLNAFQEQLIPGVTVIVGDNTEIVRNGVQFPVSDNHLILMSGLRQHSLAFHVRRWDFDKNAMVLDSDFFRRAEAIARDVSRPWSSGGERFWWDVNLKYGILILHDTITGKKYGVRQMIETCKSERVFMIGNSSFDWLDLPGVTQCAVANAKSNYKDRCSVVSDLPVTQGVGDILERIATGKL